MDNHDTAIRREALSAAARAVCRWAMSTGIIGAHGECGASGCPSEVVWQLIDEMDGIKSKLK